MKKFDDVSFQKIKRKGKLKKEKFKIDKKNSGNRKEQRQLELTELYNIYYNK